MRILLLVSSSQMCGHQLNPMTERDRIASGIYDEMMKHISDMGLRDSDMMRLIESAYYEADLVMHFTGCIEHELDRHASMVWGGDIDLFGPPLE